MGVGRGVGSMLCDFVVVLICVCHGVCGDFSYKVWGRNCINVLMFVPWCLCDMTRMVVIEGPLVV